MLVLSASLSTLYVIEIALIDAGPSKPATGLFEPSKMLGGASQTVSKIRVQCNGTQKNTHASERMLYEKYTRRR